MRGNVDNSQHMGIIMMMKWSKDEWTDWEQQARDDAVQHAKYTFKKRKEIFKVTKTFILRQKHLLFVAPMSTEHQSPLSSWGLKFRIWCRRWEVGHRCSGAFHSFVVNVHFPTKVVTLVLSIPRKHWSLLDFRPKNTKTGEQVHETAHFLKKKKEKRPGQRHITQNKYLSLPGLSLVTWWKQNRFLSDNTWRQWEHSISAVWMNHHCCEHQTVHSASLWIRTSATNHGRSPGPAVVLGVSLSPKHQQQDDAGWVHYY